MSDDLKAVNLSAERAKVRKRFPNAYAYKWGPRDWVIYAAKSGALAGIAVTGQCTSQAHAWISAARDVWGFQSPFRTKVPRLRPTRTKVPRLRPTSTGNERKGKE